MDVFKDPLAAAGVAQTRFAEVQLEKAQWRADAKIIEEGAKQRMYVERAEAKVRCPHTPFSPAPSPAPPPSLDRFPGPSYRARRRARAPTLALACHRGLLGGRRVLMVGAGGGAARVK